MKAFYSNFNRFISVWWKTIPETNEFVQDNVYWRFLTILTTHEGLARSVRKRRGEGWFCQTPLWKRKVRGETHHPPHFFDKRYLFEEKKRKMKEGNDLLVFIDYRKAFFPLFLSEVPPLVSPLLRNWCSYLNQSQNELFSQYIIQLLFYFQSAYLQFDFTSILSISKRL